MKTTLGIFCLLLTLFLSAMAYGKDYILFSPDKNIKVTAPEEEHQLSYD